MKIILRFLAACLWACSPSAQGSATNEAVPMPLVHEYAQHTLIDPQYDWKRPIEFYGQVLDQNGQPVAAATVNFLWNNISTNGTSKEVTVSDHDGFFSLTGVNGKGLSVRISKAGYYLPSFKENQMDFEYANPAEADFYLPDASKPVVFHLHKKGEPADLIQKHVEVALPDNGSGKRIDLMAGEVSTNGQLEICAWKPPRPQPMEPHYDWKVTLELFDGGFLKHNQEFPFLAPEEGYTSRIKIDMKAELGDAWQVSAEEKVFFVLENPRRYGRLTMHTDGATRFVFIEYSLNPSGSRNLESE